MGPVINFFSMSPIALMSLYRHVMFSQKEKATIRVFGPGVPLYMNVYMCLKVGQMIKIITPHIGLLDHHGFLW